MATYENLISTLKLNYDLLIDERLQQELKVLLEKSSRKPVTQDDREAIKKSSPANTATTMDGEEIKENAIGMPIMLLEETQKCEFSNQSSLRNSTDELESDDDCHHHKWPHYYKRIRKQHKEDNITKRSRPEVQHTGMKRRLQTCNKEKCRFFPFCARGNTCHYFHPSIPCAYFPKCRFGDRCLYVHEACKYGSLCKRLDCSYAHKRREPISVIATAISNGVTRFLEGKKPK